MRERVTFAASVASLVCLGVGLGIFASWLCLRTEAALMKAADVQAAHTALVKDLTEKILPAMQQQIDANISADAFAEP